jgi:capsular polysaccharide biosynthesis protein
MPHEFSPKDEIRHLLHTWWVIVICMVLGGLAGFTFNHLQQPTYQAKATLFTAIDYLKIEDVRLSEYDEDMTINSVQSVLLSNDVIGSVIEEVAAAGHAIDYKTFMSQMALYRKFTDYELFYRDSRPEVAQAVVNVWADLGVRAYQSLQRSGNLPLYIEVMPGSLPNLPAEPVHQNTNTHVVAGAILGLLIGIIISSARRVARLSNES